VASAEVPARGEPLRVLVISSMYPRPEQSTSGIFVHEQVKALIRTGHDARVVTGLPARVSVRHPGSSLAQVQRALTLPWPGWTEHDGVPIARLPYPVGLPIAPWIRPWLYARALERWLDALARDFPFDIVHGHTGFLDGRAALLAANRRQVPMVLTEHTGPLEIVTRSPFRRIHVQAAVDGADLLIAVSSALRKTMLDQLRIKDPGRLQVLPNCVDTTFFDPARIDMPSRRDTLSGQARALWIGHLVPVKRVDRLLDALARARALVPGLSLKLVGSGTLEATLRSQADTLGLAGTVNFEPSTDRAGVRQALAQADFLVISSQTETFGVVAIEALSMGLPVLATACGGPEDIIDDPTLGMIVENSTEGLADGLTKMCARRQTRDAERIRQTAIDRYDDRVIAARLASIYAALAFERGLAPGTSGQM
jgi:glycosyltransferase involved in cell wall biosynthesis